ncbi:MAG: mscL [Blastococcus sp.]|jgi:large conductance mechanosensitive channel|nr:mscL [Blastococcus sp.]
MLSGFKNFLLRGNVVDLAVAVVIGTAFTAVVNSLVNSFLTPLINVVSGGGQFGGEWIVRKQHFTWGAFVSAVIGFLLTATVVYFLVVLPVHRLLDRVVKGKEPGPVAPTEVELLVEIRDLLRARQDGAPAAPTAGRHSPAARGPGAP